MESSAANEALNAAKVDPRARRLFGGSAGALGDLAGSPFRADRDRIVSSPFFARLGGVTQVISPGGSGLLVHNRLTHSLKVAQVGRAVAERLTADKRYRDLLDSLGGCDPDVVEAAALAHDLGHPPFGHLGEEVLDRIARQRLGLPDGFEGNAQSYRIVTSTEIRGMATIGLDLTAAVRAAILKYPWTRSGYPDPHPRQFDPPPRGATAPPDDPDSGSAKFGAYSTEVEDLRQARAPFAGRIADWQQTVEASIMDTADDIAYAIHDVEDFHRVGVLRQGAVAAELLAWQRDIDRYRSMTDAALEHGLRRQGAPIERLRRQLHRKDAWISDDEAFAAAVEHVRLELVDGLLAAPFDGSIEAEQGVSGFSARWTRRLVDAITVVPDPPVRAGHVLLAPVQWHEVQVLKFVHHQFVLARPDLALHQRGQARLLDTLVQALLDWILDPREEARLPRRLHDLIDLAEAELHPRTPGRAGKARGRAIIDFVASLTDSQAVALLDALSGRSGQLWTDAFVL
ncbi:deoxyguanosinetriphosphate triphosphohydrolase family protein [Micromonospora sp. NBC_01796]|uniref:deoxyguanosinetriphosphate triphosphohydrolase family protein n=1 Tax=Micromonospora sp. NBC_01796 TaxID=2975987 RepID=UPI002DD841EB|nr:dNTP triphosphohydrolase [Micromonospora sp. NBC_01796]WSA86373.1 dNTP triphosphohydrolase [Micromonospora sp. NBC_01796]